MAIDPAEPLVHVQAMSLATRCASCGTVFRVVQDQLKVSEGWVRCGRCDDVFNALESLFDLEREVPPEWIRTSEYHARLAAADSATYADEPADIPSSLGLDHQGTAGRDASELVADARPTDARGSAHDTDDASEFVGSSASRAGGSQADVERFAGSTPAFMRGLARPLHRQSAKSRTMMTVTAFVLVCGLGGQFAHHFRDSIFARVPVMRPGLTAWCAVTGCAIDAARRIEDIAVESSALTRAPGLDAFRLSVILRNRGSIAIATPSIELSLNNSVGAVLARRSFSVHDFIGAAPRMQIGAESTLQMTLSTGIKDINGYTVEIFYP